MKCENIVNHPEYGTLTVHETIGRSRRCTDAEGKSYMLSAKVLNRLTDRAAKVLGPTPVAPEEFVASVKLYLDTLTGPTQDSTARDIWTLCDRILGNPKLGDVGQ